MAAKSLLFSDEQVLKQPANCLPGRQEVTVSFRQNGRLYTMVMRDKTTIEDPYTVLVKAAIFAVKEGEPYMGRLIPRSVRDFLIRSSVVI